MSQLLGVTSQFHCLGNLHGLLEGEVYLSQETLLGPDLGHTAHQAVSKHLIQGLAIAHNVLIAYVAQQHSWQWSHQVVGYAS